MAVSIANLTTGGDTDGGATATTASVSWSTDDLLLLTINSRTGITANPNTPTPTTTGLTWALVDATNGTSIYDGDSSSRKRTSLFYAVAGSASSGTTGLTFGGQNQTNIEWVIDRATGIDTSAPIVQINKNTDTDGGSISVTLANFGDATNNVAYGSFASDPGTGTMTNGSGFTELTDLNDGSIWTGTEWRIGQDTTVDASFDSVAGARSAGIAIEIKAATAGTVVRHLGLLGIG